MQGKEQKADRIFNEGVTLSVKSNELGEAGDVEKAFELNAQAIEKYKETLSLDNEHKVARSMLGHSYYVQNEFAEAIEWFEQANVVDGPAARNYRETGLCLLNLGQVEDGRQALEKAFELDGGPEIMEITLYDLIDLSELAWQYGEGWLAEGEEEKSRSFEQFSLTIMKLAFYFDKTNKEIARLIAEYSFKAGDSAAAEEYKMIVERL